MGLLHRHTIRFFSRKKTVNPVCLLALSRSDQHVRALLGSVHGRCAVCGGDGGCSTTCILACSRQLSVCLLVLSGSDRLVRDLLLCIQFIAMCCALWYMLGDMLWLSELGVCFSNLRQNSKHDHTSIEPGARRVRTINERLPTKNIRQLYIHEQK